MWTAATLCETIRHDATQYNLQSGTGTFDWKTLKEKRDQYIMRLNNIYLNGLKDAGVDVMEGWGRFVDAHTIQVQYANGTSQSVTAHHIVIATGGKPMIATGPGIQEHTITSDGFFELETQPTKVVVVGAGYIAVELAGVLNALGSETHLMVRKHQALRNFDQEIASFLDKEMVRQGIQIHRNTEGVASVEVDVNGKKIVKSIKGDVIIDNVDVVLMAPGRVPNVDGLDLHKAGVKQTPGSLTISVDDYQNTNVAGIYALGDVSGRVELTPMAIAAGRRLADRLFGDSQIYSQAKASYQNVPTVVFSHPTIGTCGYTEEQAIAKYGAENLKIYKSTFVNLYYSMFDMAPADKPKTFYKLICAGVTEKVVGLHLIGMASDEILQGFGVAMKMGATKADFDACVAIHPTAAEELVTMGSWGTSPQSTGALHSPLMGQPASDPPLATSKI
jgi:glutathione reductase (NADPH)